MYHSNDVGLYMLALAHQDGQNINALQLNKLVYLAHGWNLAIQGAPLCVDPAFAYYGAVQFWPLKERFSEYGIDAIPAQHGMNVLFDEKSVMLMERVWQKYRGMSNQQLSVLTNGIDTPIYQLADDGRVCVLDNDLIAKYFAARIKKREAPKKGSHLRVVK